MSPNLWDPHRERSGSDGFYDGRYIVIGPPGTGKTTFLARQVEQVVIKHRELGLEALWPNPVMICSLTRAAAAEVAGRDLPVHRSSVGTLHAHCYRGLNHPAIVEASHVASWNEDQPWTILGFGNDQGDEGDWDRVEIPREGGGDALLARLELFRHRMIPRSEWPSDVLEFEEAWTRFKLDQGVRDFTDLIEGSIGHVLEAPGSPAVIMVDEAQDLSTLEYALICQWAECARATIVVGDALQSLYAWRGASADLFNDPSVPADHRKTLSQSYRVPLHVMCRSADLVEKYLSENTLAIGVSYKPRVKPAVEGDDARGYLATHRGTIYDCEGIVDEVVEKMTEGYSVMIQATCAYMLNGVVSSLRGRGVPFSNPWRRTRSDWNPLGDRRGTTTVSRALAFVSNCPDLDRRHEWTLEDLLLWVSPIRVAGTLKRGAKGAIRVEATMGTGDRAGPATEDRSQDRVTAVQLRDWFAPEAVEFVQRVWSGVVPVETALDWWRERLLAAAMASSTYPIEVTRHYGVEALRKPPRIYVGTIHSFKGSEANCSPGDEKVLTMNKGFVVMSKLDPVTDRLPSYVLNGAGLVVGNHDVGRSFHMAKRRYSDAMLTIRTQVTATRVTPNHHVTVRWACSDVDCFMSCVIRKGDSWMLEVVPAIEPAGGWYALGPSALMARTKAESCWVVGAHRDWYTAVRQVQAMRKITGVPTRASVKDWVIMNSAVELLEDEGLDPARPLLTAGSPIGHDLGVPFTTRVQNVMPGAMLFPTIEDRAGPALWRDFEIENDPFSGFVYSLDMEDDYHYVSGGGIVHNCVYVFPDLSSAGYRQWVAGEGPERDAVVRTFYVAMTRASTSLTVCSPASTSCAPLRRDTEQLLETMETKCS